MNAQSILSFLRQQQAPDGSFRGLSGTLGEPFRPRRKQPAIFPTILIMDCLREVVGAEDIRLRAATYIESQVSSQGSWNYWDKSSLAKLRQPYPDDLDDTACAMAALMRADAKWVSGTRLGQFARLLVAAEQHPGGPYNTWLIDTERAPQWQHIDPAVNANIGYALSLQSVQLTGLNDYLSAVIKAGTFASDYYVGPTPLIYFLSRWYRGEQLPDLRGKIVGLIEDQNVGNALEQALLLTAGCQLDVPKQVLAPLADRLQRVAVGQHWPAAPFYVDPVYNQRQYYGGSAVLTTAFALEALTAYARQTLDPPVVIARKRGVPPLMSSVRQDAESIRNPHLRRRYLAVARRVMQDTAGEQITAPASLMAQAGGWRISTPTLTALNLASLNGWMAYTLYDDFLDGDQNRPAQLNVANAALRRSLSHFIEALPHQTDFNQYVKTAFDTIDSANDWELQSARAPVRRGLVELQSLPDYQDYQQLADRSWGHSLAATAVARLHYGALDHPAVLALQVFFKHFLIARQLNDDAHDWQEDLRAGRLTAVVAMLLDDIYELPQSINVTKELDILKQRFWQYTIGQVAGIIRDHIAQAQQALDDLDSQVHTSVFRGWLDALEASVTTAMQGRDETLKFMKAYEGNYA